MKKTLLSVVFFAGLVNAMDQENLGQKGFINLYGCSGLLSEGEAFILKSRAFIARTNEKIEKNNTLLKQYGFKNLTPNKPSLKEYGYSQLINI